VQQLRGPIFEDKVVNHILDVAQAEDRLVPASELAMPDANPLADSSGAGEAFAASDALTELPTETSAGAGETAESDA
jgi:hypothetical protein